MRPPVPSHLRALIRRHLAALIQVRRRTWHGLRPPACACSHARAGIDYTHPALGGAFGPGNKVAGGWDFVGDDYPLSAPVPDADPLDQCAGHGTHVAGIIAADPTNEFNVTGVAYEATLYS